VVCKTWGFRADEFQMGDLHGKYAVATCCALEPYYHLLEDKGKPRKPVSRQLIVGPSRCWIHESGKQKIKIP